MMFDPGNTDNILPVLITLCLAVVFGEVPQPPLITQQPPKLVYFRVGSGIQLKCMATGKPTPSYSWFLNGKPFNPDGGRIYITPKGGSLIFLNTYEKDAGTYQCAAKNQYGASLSIKVKFVRAFIESFKRVPTRTYYPRIGASLVLQCNLPRSAPQSRVQWGNITKDGRISPVRISDRIAIDPEGKLHFSNIRANDGNRGTAYVCMAYNTVTRTVKQSNRNVVNPTGTDRFKRTSFSWTSRTQQLLLLGDTLRLICIASGDPTPSVTWNRLNGTMPARTRFEDYGRRLIIRNLEAEDAGFYQCSARNSMSPRPQRRSFKVELESRPRWKGPAMKSITTTPGNNVTFSCQTVGIPPPKTAWFQNGVKIPGSGNLTIYNVQMTDRQVIQCNASNIHDYLFTNAYLNVVEPQRPQIISPPPPKTKASIGSSVQLSCACVAYPKAKVTWFKDDVPLTGNRFIVLMSGSLSIVNLTRGDTGRYRCLATNDVGNATDTGNLLVLQGVKILRRPTDHFAKVLQHVIFRCVATTEPSELNELTINWITDGRPVREMPVEDRGHVGVVDSRLLVTPLFASRAYPFNYSCVVNVSYDSAVVTATLVVKDVPNPPYQVGVDCNFDSAKVFWRPGPSNGLSIYKYIVQYNTSFEPFRWYDSEVYIVGIDNYATIKLSPWASYNFRVLAKNRLGLSKPSGHTKTVCRTAPALPSRNPYDVSTDGGTPNALTITWTPMPQIDHNGPGFSYLVQYKKANNLHISWSTVRVEDYRIGHLVLHNQGTYQPFLIKVTATNNLGHSPVAAIQVTGYSAEAVPRVAPKYLRFASAKRNRNIDVQWEAVNTEKDTIRGFFRGYRLNYEITRNNQRWNAVEDHILFERGKRGFHPKPGEYVNFTLRNLPHESTVSATVAVLNTYYVGPPSNAINFTTLRIPDEPTGLEVTDRGLEYLDIRWAHYPASNYSHKIHYRRVEGLKMHRMQELRLMNSPFHETRINLLKPASCYRLYVRAASANGMGRPTYLQSCTRGVPLQVGTLTVVGVTNTSIFININKPKNNTYHKLEYSIEGSNRWKLLYQSRTYIWQRLTQLQANATYRFRLTTAHVRYYWEHVTSDITYFRPDHSDILISWNRFRVEFFNVSIVRVSWQPVRAKIDPHVQFIFKGLQLRTLFDIVSLLGQDTRYLVTIQEDNIKVTQGYHSITNFTIGEGLPALNATFTLKGLSIRVHSVSFFLQGFNISHFGEFPLKRSFYKWFLSGLSSNISYIVSILDPTTTPPPTTTTGSSSTFATTSIGHIPPKTEPTIASLGFTTTPIDQTYGKSEPTMASVFRIYATTPINQETRGPDKRSKDVEVGLKVGLPIGALVLLFVIIVIVISIVHYQRTKHADIHEGIEMGHNRPGISRA